MENTTTAPSDPTLRFSGEFDPVPQDRVATSTGGDTATQVFNEAVRQVQSDERPVELVQLQRKAEVVAEELVEEADELVADEPVSKDVADDQNSDLELLAKLPGVELVGDGSFILRDAFDAQKLGEAELQAMSRVFVRLLVAQDSSSLLQAPTLVLLRLGELLEALPQLYRERLQSELNHALDQQAAGKKAGPGDMSKVLAKPFQPEAKLENAWKAECRAKVSSWLDAQLTRWKSLGADPKALGEDVLASVSALQAITKGWGATGLRAGADTLQDFIVTNSRVLTGLHSNGCTLKQLVELHFGSYMEGAIAAERFYDYAVEHRARELLEKSGEAEGSVFESFPRNSEYHHVLNDLIRLFDDEERFKARKSPGDVEAYDLTCSAIEQAVKRYTELVLAAREQVQAELQSGDKAYDQLLRAYGDSIHHHVAAKHARGYFDQHRRSGSEQCKRVIAQEVKAQDEAVCSAEERIQAWYGEVSKGKDVHTLKYRLSALQEIKDLIKPGAFDLSNPPKELLGHVNTWSLNRARGRAHTAVRGLLRRYDNNPAINTANSKVLQLRRPAALRSQEVKLGERYAERLQMYGQAWRVN